MLSRTYGGSARQKIALFLFYSSLWGSCSQFIHSEAEIFGMANITWYHSAEWQEHDSCPRTSDFIEQRGCESQRGCLIV